MSWKHLEKNLCNMSWKRFWDVFKRFLQDVLKTFGRFMTKTNIFVLIKTFWGRLPQEECLLGNLTAFILEALSLFSFFLLSLPFTTSFTFLADKLTLVTATSELKEDDEAVLSITVKKLTLDTFVHWHKKLFFLSQQS